MPDRFRYDRVVRSLLLFVLCAVVAANAEDFDRKVVARGSFTYPNMARTTRTQGTVDLLLDIDEKGTVVKAVVATPTSPRLLHQAAIDSILTWRFEPSDRPTLGAPFVYVFKITGDCPKNPCTPDLVFEPPNKVTINVKAIRIPTEVAGLLPTSDHPRIK